MANDPRPFKDWEGGDEILHDDLQAYTDALRGRVTVTGRNVRQQRGPDGQVNYHIDDSIAGRAVLVWVTSDLTYNSSPLPSAAGQGGMYYGTIIKDIGQETTQSFLGDVYSSSGTSPPGGVDWSRLLGGFNWKTSATLPDCIVVNIAETGVLQSRQLSGSGLDNANPIEGAIWIGIVMGQTLPTDTLPSLPIVYVKGVVEWPCRVVITGTYDDAESGIGWYLGKMKSGQPVMNSSTGPGSIGSNFWDQGQAGEYDNAVILNLPEAKYGSAAGPWIDVPTDTGNYPLFLGHRVAAITRRGSPVENFHFVMIAENMMRRTGAISLLTLSPTPTLSDVASKVNDIIYALRSAKVIST